MANTKIVLNKQSDLVLTNAVITSPSGLIQNDIDGLVSRFEEVEGRVDSILDLSTEDKNQFFEIVDFVTGIDTENDLALIEKVGEINNRIDDEVATLGNVDAQNQTDLTNHINNTTTEIGLVTDSINKEVTDREAGDNNIIDTFNTFKDDVDTDFIDVNTSIGTETDARIAGDQSLQSNIDSLSSDLSDAVQDREDAVAALQADVDQNEADADSAIAALQADVDANEADADSAIATVASDLSSYESSNDSALAAVVADLSSEVQNRKDADDALDGKITDIVENTDFSKVDSFKETIDKVNEITAENFDSIYAKKVGVTLSGSDVVLATPVKPESMMLYINGLMVESDGVDYTETSADGSVTGATLIGDALVLAQDGAKISAYGVHGTFSDINFIGQAES